jgi:hypothetical protein
VPGCPAVDYRDPKTLGAVETLLQDARRALHERDVMVVDQMPTTGNSVVAAVLGLAVFVVYASVRAFWGSAYYVPNYHYFDPVLLTVRQRVVRTGRRPLRRLVGQVPVVDTRWQSSRCRSCWGSD